MATLTKPETYESVKRWYTKLQAKSRSMDFSKSQTKRAATYWLKVYCQFTGKSPDTIIAERTKQLENQEIIVRRKHEEIFEKFITHLQTTKNTLGKPYSSGSISTATGLVRSFYKSNYIALIEVPTVRPQLVRAYKVPETKDVKKMVEIADDEMRAWILSQFNSSLGNADLLALRMDTLSSEFGTIKTQLKKGVCPIHVEIHRQKTGERTDSFFGPNAIEALNNYVNLNSRGALFRISVRTIQDKVKRLSIKSKVATEKVPVTPYGLRRGFNTLMKLAGMNEAIAERMMGHSITKVRSAYLVTGETGDIKGIPISKLAEVYMQCYHAIDITKV